MKGYIHSFQSLGTVDGPGVRCVIFMQGCPLRCAYCHNPDTWEENIGETIEPQDLMDKVLKYKGYIKNGGVTVSGGEALLQAEFVTEFFKLCHENGVHTALDTSGFIINKQVEKLLDETDLCLLDVKMTNEDDYLKYTRQSFSSVIDFLKLLNSKKIDTWVRHVIVKGINDTKENIKKLNMIISNFSCIKKIELLAFRKLCLEKYENMGIDFPLKNIPETDKSTIDKLQSMIVLSNEQSY